MSLLVHLLNEVRKNFRVGLAQKLMALPQELGFDRDIVFNNPVVNDCNFIFAVRVRVRIDVVRLTVGCPARVPHPHKRSQILVHELERRSQFGDFSLLFLHHQSPVLDERYAGGVISSILKASKTLKNDRNTVALPNISDDSTHGCPLKKE